MDASGDEIEWDLRHELGIDLIDYFRGARPWAQLYRFLARLPRHSHFHASVMDDDDAVKQLLSRERPAGFGLVGWTFERELLTAAVDALNQLHATLIQVNSDDGKRPKVESLPRPTTALDRMARDEELTAHRNRVRLLRPAE